MTPARAEAARVLIVDDEPLARRRLRELVGDDPEVTVSGECGNGRDAVAAIRRDEPDIVLLDVQMPEVDGFGVVREVGADKMPVVVFVTASDAHAVRAFEIHAVDYVLKPVERERFAEALRRAKQSIVAPSAPTDSGMRQQLAALLAEMTARGLTAPPPRAPAQQRLVVKVDGRMVFVPAANVDWAESLDNHVRLHVGRETMLVRETMTNLEQRLPPEQFIRIHRSTLVNTDRIREIQPWFGGDYVIILTDGTKLTSGRRYRAVVHALLDRAL
jgi:two-component system LytT family response regulator